MHHAVITANRLTDGVAVWRGADAAWHEHFASAAVTLDAEAPLVEAQADVARRLVVGVYKVSVTLQDGQPIPDNVRERIRASGPSVRRDLGMQAGAI